MLGLLAALIAFPFLTGFGPPSLSVSDSDGVRLYSWHLQTMRGATAPRVPALAYQVIDLDSGDVIWSRNAGQRLAMASITKIMTALVTLRHGNLQDVVTIAKADEEGEATMGLREGDMVTVEHLLYGLLLPSGNDAGKTLARHIGGGDPGRFMQMMNDQAAELGMHDTHFVNPHGLDEDGHFSTAADIAVMAREAMKDARFATIVATPEIVIQGSRQFWLRNSNRLLRHDNLTGAPIGVKTGWTEAAGDSLVAAERVDGRHLLTVVLNANDRTATSATLLKRAWQSVSWFVPTVGPWSAIGGGDGRAIPVNVQRIAPIPLMHWQRYFVQGFMRPVNGYDVAGQTTVVGSISYSLDHRQLRSADLSVLAR